MCRWFDPWLHLSEHWTVQCYLWFVQYQCVLKCTSVVFASLFCKFRKKTKLWQNDWGRGPSNITLSQAQARLSTEEWSGLYWSSTRSQNFKVLLKRGGRGQVQVIQSFTKTISQSEIRFLSVCGLRFMWGLIPSYCSVVVGGVFHLSHKHPEFLVFLCDSH